MTAATLYTAYSVSWNLTQRRNLGCARLRADFAASQKLSLRLDEGMPKRWPNKRMQPTARRPRRG